MTHWWNDAKERERLERHVRLLETRSDAKQRRIEYLERRAARDAERIAHLQRGLQHRTSL